MGKFWDRFFSGLRRSAKAEDLPPRRSPWVLVAYASPDPGLQCHFCGRAEASGEPPPDQQGGGQFGLVQARHNPRLQHVVCADCLRWNRISPA